MAIAIENNMNKLLIIAIGLTLIGAGCERFNVSYVICDVNYEKCQTIGKFKNMSDCETTNEKWGWYCDQTDQQDIRCRAAGKSSISRSYCKD